MRQAGEAGGEKNAQPKRIEVSPLVDIQREKLANLMRELQEINYPILWSGHLARPVDMALVSPTPQESIGYFLFVSP
ncbi:MAG: hypothetical protein V7L22_06510 [Nostoc sp.]|uniref:hypothetical protein n=1 Tax=Nostoc sp. TaxID=1180 RepID=UPI002FF59023